MTLGNTPSKISSSCSIVLQRLGKEDKKQERPPSSKKKYGNALDFVEHSSSSLVVGRVG
jgi:hypothetical protein